MKAQFQTELDLIQEAYIEPIRSVLIIDDEYPTWEDWLSGEASAIESEQGNNRNWAKFEDIKSLIDEIRKMNPARIVDIHNGDRDDADFKDYMHQSDLLILDYELEPGDSEGKKFLNIAHDLLENSIHFNLILTHTNSDDLSEPFAKLLRSFLNSYDSFDSGLCDKGDDILDKFDNNKEEVKNSIWHKQYAAFRRDEDRAKEQACRGEEPFTGFYTHCDSQKFQNCENFALFMSLLKGYERKFRTDFRNESAPEGLTWSTSEPFWIKTNRGFITFAKKAVSLDVVTELKDALVSWNPTPSRLLSARFRAEIESQGGIFEESFLSDNHVAWMFYQKLLKEFPDALETNLRKEIQRQMEHYTDAILDNLIEFGRKMVSSDIDKNGNESQNSEAYKLKFSDENFRDVALDNFNSFVSCKPRTGNNLTPGHIFSNSDDKVWIVLSPACDLVPNRGRPKMDFICDKSVLHFTAVRLYEVEIETAREKATSTNYVFLRKDDGGISAYRFYGSGDDDAKAPQYKTFLAKNGGKFDLDGKFQLMKISKTDKGIEETSEEVSIHKRQLRYEYALNLMAKLSAHTTRIGLEFEDSRFFK